MGPEEHPIRFLSNFKGYVQADAYDKLFARGSGRTKLALGSLKFEAKETDAERSMAALAFIVLEDNVPWIDHESPRVPRTYLHRLRLQSDRVARTQGIGQNSHPAPRIPGSVLSPDLLA